MTLAELAAQIERDPYNEVAAHLLPNGELCVSLSHRITMDECVLVRVRADVDVIRMVDEDERFEVVSTRVRTSQLVDLKIEADRSGMSVYDLLAQIIERWRPKL